MSGFFEYNGSAVVAMKGESCVGIACDHRLGYRQFTTVGSTFPKIYRFAKKSFVGVAGLATDGQTLCDHLQYKKNLYCIKENREIGPKTLSNLLSTMLYEHRFAPWFVSPVVAGLDEKNEPFISTFDFIGAPDEADDFVVAGAVSEHLFGVCESFWKPNLKPEELFEILSQCLVASIDRSCVSGWGASVYIITPDKTIYRQLKTRMD